MSKSVYPVRFAGGAVLLWAGLIIAGLAVAPPGSALAGDWKGEVATEAGIEVVKSPAQPMEAPVTIQLEELWRIGGDTDAEEEFFGVINRITTDAEGNVYLLDNQLNEVKVFSADGEYVNTLGQEGEGPGEFRTPQDMFLLPNGNIGVLQLAPGRIVMLTKSGDPAGEHPIPEPKSGDTPILIAGQTMGDNLCLVVNENQLGEGKIDITRAITLVDSEGNEIKRMHAEVRTMEFASGIIDEKVWSTFDRRWAVGPDDKLYISTAFQDYEVRVFDKSGKEVRHIEREYDSRKRNEAEIAQVKGIFEAFTRQVPNARIVVSDYDQDVAALFPRKDGSLWVMNARGFRSVPEGSLGKFDVFDEQGRFVREVTLMGQGDPQQDGYFFVGDRLYVVTGFLDAAMAAQGGAEGAELDEDAEPMAVICYRIDTSKAGM